jgi:hypothetical protein
VAGGVPEGWVGVGGFGLLGWGGRALLRAVGGGVDVGGGVRLG